MFLLWQLFFEERVLNIHSPLQLLPNFDYVVSLIVLGTEVKAVYFYFTLLLKVWSFRISIWGGASFCPLRWPERGPYPWSYSPYLWAWGSGSLDWGASRSCSSSSHLQCGDIKLSLSRFLSITIKTPGLTLPTIGISIVAICLDNCADQKGPRVGPWLSS